MAEKWHEPQEPTVDERGDEHHPAFGMISAMRVSSSPGAVLFDSDIRHQHSIVIRIGTARRQRNLNHDWHFASADGEFVEIQMSEAQFGAFVSSPNTSGVPCTIRRRGDDINVPGVPFSPRLRESVKEVEGAAEKAMERVMEAFAAYKEKKSAANLRSLESAIGGVRSNMKFAADSLTEHVENVVAKARADIENQAVAKARQLGLDPADLGATAELMSGDDDDPPAKERPPYDDGHHARP